MLGFLKWFKASGNSDAVESAAKPKPGGVVAAPKPPAAVSQVQAQAVAAMAGPSKPAPLAAVSTPLAAPDAVPIATPAPKPAASAAAQSHPPSTALPIAVSAGQASPPPAAGPAGTSSGQAASTTAPAKPSVERHLETKVEPYKSYSSRLPNADFVIIEMFGGDNNLSAFVRQDLEEMAAGISGGNIAVIGLTDLEGKPAAVVEVTPKGGVEILEELGEIDTGDPEVLHKFLVRALLTYPKARKAIGFWDHGTGVFDETDNSEKIMTRKVHSVAREDRSRSRPARRLFFAKKDMEDDVDTRAMLHDDTNGGVLTNLEAGAMLRAAFKDAGVTEKVDLLFSDTCLNGMVEVLEELGSAAKVIVASQDLEPGDGWNYRNWLERVVKEPPAKPEDWGRQAVQAFKDSYEAFPKKWPCTLAAFRTEHNITKAFGGLIDACKKANGHATFIYLDHARAQAQGFAQRDTYDMRDFAEKVASVFQQSNPEIAAAAKALIEAYDAARVHSINLGKFVPNSTGLSFYFPSSRSQMNRDIGTYEKLAFARNSGWAEFLKAFR